MSWLEISLTVDGEMAEAVAEVLARYIPGGVVVESTTIATELDGPGYPIGPLRVCGYLPVDAQLEETRQQIEKALYFLGRIQPLPVAQFTPVAEINWAEAWKKHYRPVRIGERLIIVPSWLTPPTPPVSPPFTGGTEGGVRIPIRIDPGMAFGTGTHPTTQLCLELLEEALTVFAPPSPSEQGQQKKSFRDGDVLDVGCGSGILSIAALKLGASRAFGVDTEHEAITAAEENAQTNQVADNARFAVGSVAQICQGIFPIRQAPVVVANILAHILIQLLDEGLSNLVASGGVLLLSGILEEQLPNMRTALEKHHLNIIAQRQIEDWVALTVTP